MLWQTVLPGGVKTVPAFDRKLDIIIFGLTTGEAVALVYSTGKRHWKSKTGPHVANALIVNGKALVLTNRSDLPDKTVLRSLVLSNSREYWHTFTEGVPQDMIPVEEKNGSLLILTGDYKPAPSESKRKSWIYLIVSNGKISWRAEVPPDTLPSLLYVSRYGLVVFTTRSGWLIALRAFDGKEVWRTEIGTEMAGKPALFFPLSDAVIATVSGDGVFSLRRAKDGTEIARKTVEAGATTVPVMSEDMAYVLTPGHLHIFGGLLALIDKAAATPRNPAP